MAKLELDVGQIVELLKQLAPHELEQVFQNFNVSKDESAPIPAKENWPYGMVLTDAAIGGGMSKPAKKMVAPVLADKAPEFSEDRSSAASIEDPMGNSKECFSEVAEESASEFSVENTLDFSSEKPEESPISGIAALNDSDDGSLGSDRLNLDGLLGKPDSEHSFTITSPINRLDMLSNESGDIHGDEELDPEEALRLELNLTLDDEDSDDSVDFSGPLGGLPNDSESEASSHLNESAEELIGKFKPSFGIESDQSHPDPLAGLNFGSSPVESHPGFVGTEDPLAGLNFDSSPVESHPGLVGAEDPLAGLNYDSSTVESHPGLFGAEDPLAGLNYDSSTVESHPGLVGTEDPLAGLNYDSSTVESHPGLVGTEDPLAGLNFDSSTIESHPGLVGTEDPLAGLNFDSSSVESHPGLVATDDPLAALNHGVVSEDDSKIDFSAPSGVDSFAEVIAPVAEVIAPVAEVIAPVAEVIAPVAEVVTPVAEFVTPVAEVVTPVAEVVTPVVEFAAPVSEVVPPVAELAAPSITSMTPLAELQGLYELFGKVREESGNLPDGRFRTAIAQAVCEIRGTEQPAGSNRLDG